MGGEFASFAIGEFDQDWHDTLAASRWWVQDNPFAKLDVLHLGSNREEPCGVHVLVGYLRGRLYFFPIGWPNLLLGWRRFRIGRCGRLLSSKLRTLSREYICCTERLGTLAVRSIGLVVRSGPRHIPCRSDGRVRVRLGLPRRSP